MHPANKVLGLYICPIQHFELLFCLKTIAKLIVGVRVIVGICKLINTAVPAKQLTNSYHYMQCKYVSLSVHMSRKRYSLTGERILMKLYTVVVYALRMCMQKILFQTISREIIQGR